LMEVVWRGVQESGCPLYGLFFHNGPQTVGGDLDLGARHVRPDASFSGIIVYSKETRQKGGRLFVGGSLDVRKKRRMDATEIRW